MDFYVVFGTNVWDVCGHLLPSCPEWCGFRAIMVWLVGQRGSGCFGAQQQQSAGEGFLAVAICHETDHLDGTVYVDRMIEDVSDRYRQIKGDEKR